MINSRLVGSWLTAIGTSACLLVLPAESEAALLGVTPQDPVIEFGAGGVVDYDAATGLVTISGQPASLFQADPFIFALVMGTGVDDERLLSIQFHVDATGNFASGVAGADLIVKGSVDVNFDGVPDYDGVLLQGEVMAFGFENGTPDDYFDVRVGSLTGALAPLFSGSNLGVRVVSLAGSEYPNAFNGSFAVDFANGGEGSLGKGDTATPAICAMTLDAYCSVDGGPNSDKCRVKVTKSPQHWDWEDDDHNGHHFKRYTYGMHGQPMPAWSTRYAATPVKFTYVLKNTGTTPIGGLTVDDSFDTPVPGVPATLAAGATATLIRTEPLRDGIENSVMAVGEYQTATCGASDTVIIKDKLRERRRHDDDDYKDKGRDDRNDERR